MQNYGCYYVIVIYIFMTFMGLKRKTISKKNLHKQFKTSLRLPCQKRNKFFT